MGVGGGGQARCVRRSEVFVQNFFFFVGGGGVRSGWSGLGVRVDVNKELKFL